MQIINASFKKILFFGLMVSLFQSCVSHKSMITLNGAEEAPVDLKSDEVVQYTQLHKFEAYKIRPFDLLLIKVNAFDGSSEDFLNREFKTENTYSSTIRYNPSDLYFNSYSVDEAGFIHLPLIGDIAVDGLTAQQIKTKLDEAYLPYLKFASTSIKLSNSRVTVFGEVNDPGVYYLYNDKNTILDAISLAGDFTEFGNREKVKLIRLTEEGSETIYLNLNRSDFIYTQYYFIKPSDVIYIEPTKGKARDVSSRVVSVVLAAISVTVLVISFVISP
jgi:polysaccharide biosynthesis/export protein